MAFVKNYVQPLTARLFDSIYRYYFEVIQADTPERLKQVYTLRYQVYADEHGFENPDEFPDKQETDEFDAHSVHILLRHRRTKICIGTARAILPKQDDPLNSFPVQKASSHPMLHDAEIARYATEFSRLAISKEYLKQSCDASGPTSVLHFDPTCKDKRFTMWLTKRIVRFLSVGLMAGVLEIAARRGYPIMFAVMEPFRIRNLSKIGFEFPFKDAAVNYHGLRHPCGLPSLYDAFVTMKRVSPSSWEIISRGGHTQQLAWEAENKSEEVRLAVEKAKKLAHATPPAELNEPELHQAAE
jgi:N-acyl amino acid synthase of PEP-CTERM/exosortase system